MRVVSFSPRVSTEVAPASSAWRAFLAASFSARRAAPIGDVQLGVVGSDEGVGLGQERLVGLAQGGQEVQGAAEEHDGAADRASARQAGDGLGGDGVEDGGGQIARWRHPR